MAKRRKRDKARVGRGRESMESKSSTCSRIIQSSKVTPCASVHFVFNLLCVLHSLPGFPKRLKDVLEPDSSLFRILAKDIKGPALEGALHAWEPWHPRLDFGRLGKGGSVMWIDAVGRVSYALEDGHILGEGKVNRRYAGRHRSWIKVRDFAHVGLCGAPQQSDNPSGSLLCAPDHAFCSNNASFRVY